MDERMLDGELERAFGEVQAFADQDAFARAVQTRIERGWAIRTFGLAAAGVSGGSIALTQALGAGLALRLRQASDVGFSATGDLYRKALSEVDLLSQFGGSANLFLAAAAVFVVVAVAASRLLDES